MKKMLVNLMLPLTLISSSAFANQADAIVAHSYATLVETVASIADMSSAGTISAQQTGILIDMQLNTLKIVAMSDERLNGKKAQLSSADIGCFQAHAAAQLKNAATGAIATANATADILAEIRDAQDEGKIKFPACSSYANGSERGK